MPKAPAAATQEALPLDEETATPEEAAPAPAPAPARTARKKPAALPSLFTPLEDEKEYLRVLYWGREGSGKTTAALTMANKGKVLLINAEGGARIRPLRGHGIDTSNIMTFPPQGVELTHESLEAVYLQIKSDLDKDPESWAGVVVDSATDIAQILVDVVATDRVTKYRNKGNDVDSVDAYFTDRNDYGTMGKMFRKMLKQFRGLPCHFVVTALERRDVDEDTGKTQYGPAVSPGVATDLLGYMDMVLYTKGPDDDRDYFRASCRKSGRFRSKDRLNALPATLVDPTFERVLAYAEEDLFEDQDPLQAVTRAPEPTDTPEQTEDAA